MTSVRTIGLDIAKNIFQVHGVDAEDRIVVRRQLRRAEILRFFASIPPFIVGMEACTSSHFWAREIGAFGHAVRLMPPAYVKPYVKRGKTDAADAAAICEAVTRPTMRFVPVKSAEQQAVLMLHRARELLVRQRIAAQGPGGLARLLSVFKESETELPSLAKDAVGSLIEQCNGADRQIEAIEVKIMAWHRVDSASRRLATIPGVGPITASAIAVSVSDASLFRSGRRSQRGSV